MIKEEEEIEVLYNDCYGGWNISNKALELYKERNPQHSNQYVSDKLLRNSIERTDTSLIQIYKELGYVFNTGNGKIQIEKIPKKYKEYYFINEYDGNESVEIDYTQYKLDNITNTINQILQSDLTNNEKMKDIENYMTIFNTERYNN
jgi:hypothetical protein